MIGKSSERNLERAKQEVHLKEVLARLPNHPNRLYIIKCFTKNDKLFYWF